MMTSYEETKEKIFAWRGPGKVSIVMATLVASVFTAVFSLPFDNIKTKIQKQKAGPDGVMPYRSVMDCFMKTI